MDKREIQPDELEDDGADQPRVPLVDDTVPTEPDPEASDQEEVPDPDQFSPRPS